MNSLKLNIRLAVCLGISLLALILLTCQVEADDKSNSGEQLPLNGEQQLPSARARFVLPKLIDFDQFKQIFKKRYKSLVEELAKKKLFVARLFSSFVSTVSYKLGRLTSYLSLNPTSDWTPEERKRSLVSSDELRQGMQLMVGKPMPEHKPEVKDEQPVTVDSDQLAAAIEQVERRKQEPAYKALAEELEQMGAAKLKAEAESLAGKKPSGWLESLLSGAGKALQSQANDFNGWDFFDDQSGDDDELILWPGDSKLPDRLFVDHRRTGCLQKVKNQGDCGSCYAFTTTAFFEYQFCRQTGNKFAMSEQYMVDCGHRAGTKGCDGGSMVAAFNFVRDFGLEQSANYLYREKRDQCAYSDEHEWHQMGEFRWLEQRSKWVEPKHWFSELEFSPIFVGIKVNDKFHDYGGGVDLNLDCPDDRGHAMLLVGYGREDGKDYALFRNSHSSLWGEQGYYKMGEESIERCAVCPGHVSYGQFVADQTRDYRGFEALTLRLIEYMQKQQQIAAN